MKRFWFTAVVLWLPGLVLAQDPLPMRPLTAPVEQLPLLNPPGAAPLAPPTPPPILNGPSGNNVPFS